MIANQLCIAAMMGTEPTSITAASVENWILEYDMERTLQTIRDQVPWYIGAVVCAVFILKLLIWIYQLLSRRQFVWLVGGDKWAVVTGATDGIGIEFAAQLADKGYNLMLLSRNEEKLQRTKQRIQDKSKTNKSNNNNKEIQIETLAVDFSELDIYDRIKQFLDLDHRDIFVLVNNVGMGNQFPDTFLNNMKMVPDIWQRMINVNLLSTTKMTELVLPFMVAQNRGLILNVASFASFYPNPLISAYAATKAYVRHLSIGLAEEYQANNILILCLNPGVVSTNMTNNIKSSFVPSASEYVKSALNKVQNMNCYEITGHWIHQLLKYFGIILQFVLPDYLFYRIIHKILLKNTIDTKKRLARSLNEH